MASCGVGRYAVVVPAPAPDKLLPFLYFISVPDGLQRYSMYFLSIA
jgi:hypothetical protein